MYTIASIIIIAEVVLVLFVAAGILYTEFHSARKSATQPDLNALLGLIQDSPYYREVTYTSSICGPDEITVRLELDGPHYRLISERTA